MVRPRVLIQRIPVLFASLYEKASRMVLESYYRQIAEEVVAHLKSGRILDLGTGPGYLPIGIAQRSSNLQVDGIDLSRSLIRMARENASRAGVSDRARFEPGDATNLSTPDQTYDLVLSTGMLHMLKDPLKMFRECYRVLKPGGEAWIYDPARVSSQIDRKQWKGSLNLSEKIAYLLFIPFSWINPGRKYTQAQVEKILEDTPFKVLKIQSAGKELKIRLKKP
jgi:ubiquinone/menaquinone biosynthesis C-methylase UbiE